MNKNIKNTIKVLMLGLVVVSCGSAGSSTVSQTPTVTPTVTPKVEPTPKPKPQVNVPRDKNTNLTNNVNYGDENYDKYTNVLARNTNKTTYQRTLPKLGELENNRFNSKGNINWNSDERVYNQHNMSNLPINTSFKGQNVKIGIIDDGFNKEKDFNALLKLTTNVERVKTPYIHNKGEHGVNVVKAALEISPNAHFVVGDTGQEDGYVADDTIYLSKIFDKGVRIFSNSYGLDADGKNIKITLRTFVKKAVEDGALFIWSGGNDKTSKLPAKHGAAPMVEPTLEKGWINVIGLAPKNNTLDFSLNNLTA